MAYAVNMANHLLINILASGFASLSVEVSAREGIYEEVIKHFRQNAKNYLLNDEFINAAHVNHVSLQPISELH